MRLPPSILAVAAALALVLAGCDGDAGPAASSTTASPQTSVTAAPPETRPATTAPATAPEPATGTTPSDAAAPVAALTASLGRFAALAAGDPGDGSVLAGPALLARMEREQAAAEAALAGVREAAEQAADDAARSRLEAVAIGGDEAVAAMRSVIANGRAGDPAAAAEAAAAFSTRRAELQGYLAGEGS